MYAIQTQQLSKRYGKLDAVRPLELTVEQGELFSLLGVNGAGKTTTIRMLSCLTRPTGGDAQIMGNSILHQPMQVRQLIGFSPQETAVAPNLTVEENLLLMCGFHGIAAKKAKELSQELLNRFRLEEVARRRAGRLSGGWQRRLSIAMAMISGPQVLFLDEPTLGLDVLARSELWELIQNLHGKVTVILTTHYMEEAEMLSDRIGIMKHGQLLTAATAQELKDRTGKDRFEDAFIAIVRGNER